jgi:hypothetical protein
MDRVRSLIESSARTPIPELDKTKVHIYTLGIVVFTIVLMLMLYIGSLGQAIYIAFIAAFLICRVMRKNIDEFAVVQTVFVPSRLVHFVDPPRNEDEPWTMTPSRPAEKGEQVCQICLTDAVNTAVDPCGHLFCGGCVRAMVDTNGANGTTAVRCPLCRETVRKTIRVFLDKDNAQT